MSMSTVLTLIMLLLNHCLTLFTHIHKSITRLPFAPTSAGVYQATDFANCPETAARLLRPRKGASFGGRLKNSAFLDLEALVADNALCL